MVRSNSMIDPNTRLIWSTANNANPQGPLRMSGAETNIEFIEGMTTENEKTPFDGIEVHPIFPEYGTSPRELGRLAAKDCDIILHASFRQTRVSREYLSDEEYSTAESNSSVVGRLMGRAMESQLGNLIMPDAFESMKWAGAAQKAMDRRVAVTYYLHPDRDADQEIRNWAVPSNIASEDGLAGGKVLIQPTDFVAHQFKAKTLEDFADELRQRKIDSVYDIFHAAKGRYGDQAGPISRDPLRTLDVLRPAGIHISLGREDLPTTEALKMRTRQDLAAALSENDVFSKETTEIFEHLMTTDAGKNVLYMVLEATADQILSPSIKPYDKTERALLDNHKGREGRILLVQHRAKQIGQRLRREFALVG